MGTRGAYELRFNNQNKVTYNNYDSYPSELSRNVLNYVSRISVEKMRSVADKIILITRDEFAPADLIQKYKKLADLSESRNSLQDWYCLLRNTQGRLNLYHKDSEHIIDAGVFLADSFLCR